MENKECKNCEIRQQAEELDADLDKWWRDMAGSDVREFVAVALQQHHPDIAAIMEQTTATAADILWQDFNVLLKGSVFRVFAAPIPPEEKQEHTGRICSELSDLALSYRYGIPIDDMTYDNGDLFPRYHSTYTFIYSKIKGLLDACITGKGIAVN